MVSINVPARAVQEAEDVWRADGSGRKNTSRRMYGDFHAHSHGGHSEPISEFSRHREVVLLRGWTWSRDALSGDTRRPRTHFQVIF